MTQPIGAIRWDAWYSTASGTVAEAAIDALSWSAYQARAPRHAFRQSPRTLKLAPSQAVMDEEIRIAALAGLGYWAFLRYVATPSMSIGWDLYQASAIRAQVPWCSIVVPDFLGSTDNYAARVAAIVAEFQQPHYFKVQGNRPLFYIYTPQSLDTFGGDNGTGRANFKAALDALRSATVAAGLGQPYVVVMMEQSPSLTYHSAFGSDALSAYSYGMNTTRACSYAEHMDRCATYWNTYTALGAQFVPTCMIGWDPRPNFHRPAGYAGPAVAYEGMDRYVVAATTSEMNAHIQAAIDFANARPAVCPAGILIYAHNEHSEGGWLGRTIDDTNPNGARYSALAATFKQGA